MGMFTSIRHPIDGREIQLKFGDDFCERYSVGDTISWKPTEWNLDRHPDGVHRGYGYDVKPDCWVVVKNLQIVHVEDISQEREELEEDDEGWTSPTRYAELVQQFGIEPPSRDLWKEEWRSAAAERAAQRKKEHEEMIVRDRADGIDTTTLGYALSMPIRRNLDYDGIARRIFKTTSFKEGT